MSDLELTDIALEFVSKRAVQAPVTKTLVEQCFREAQIFLDVATAAEGNLLDLGEVINPLDEADAPNLRKNHPLRVISRSAYTDPKTGHCDVARGMNRIAEIWAEIQKLPANLDKDFVLESKGLDWSVAEINLARTHLPAVLDRAEKLKVAAGK